MTRSQWRWWCALRPVFLYHCMWPPIWSPFQWQGGGLSYPRPYDQTRHVTPAHHRLLAVELASLVLIREAYCQQEISVSETEATSGKILGGEARSLRVLVLSPVGQGQGRGSSTCSECGLHEALLSSGRKWTPLLQEQRRLALLRSHMPANP